MKKQIVIKLQEIKKDKWTGIIYGLVDDKKTDYKSSSGTFKNSKCCGVNLTMKITEIEKWMEQIA